MQTKATTDYSKRSRAAPQFSSTEINKWDLLLRAYLKRDGAEWTLDHGRPEPNKEKLKTLLGPMGDETAASRAYMKRMRNKTLEWSKKNGIAYSAIVEGCTDHNGAMIVVMERAGNDEAKGLYDALMKKFRIHHTALLQMELARFNGMKMYPNDSGSDYVNRILEAKVKLSQFVYKDLQDDIHLLERLKTGLKTNAKYAQLATTLQCMPAITWDGAVEQITAYDQLHNEEEANARVEKAHLARAKDLSNSATTYTKRYKRCKKTGHIARECYTKMRNGRLDGGRNRGGSNLTKGRRYDSVSTVSIKCFNCDGPHKAIDCPHRYASQSKRARLKMKRQYNQSLRDRCT